ncbi:hypothetical protein LCGC14_1169570 [marine sediment metagenome]|uniref:Uncharacterized protein n=1 Tax=marine sediment metagenome TaxID=412755 RepID=A0A0F9LV71_9ZZZZ
MSGNVVSFPVKKEADEDRIWICECGCQTHYVHEDGRIECALCEKITTEGNWRVGPKIELAEDLKVCDVRITDEADEFIFRRFVQEVIKPDVSAAALFRKDGSQRTVFRNKDLPQNETERRWFRRRARRMLIDLGADWKHQPR